MSGWRELKEQVVDKQLCCLCGTCIGICPVNTLEYENTEITDTKGRCIECGQCVKVCPGKGFDYPVQNMAIFGAEQKDVSYELGYYNTIMKGSSNDPFIREHAASGGVATELGCFLLEKRLVDYVIGVTGDINGYKAEALRTREEVLTTMQSKYVFVPVNEIIRFIMEHEGKYLYVALPCQIQGMRKAAEVQHVLKERIALYAGIYCGFNMTQEATDLLIQKSGIQREAIKTLEYRGRHNGETGFLIRSSQKDFFVAKHGYTILNAFYSRPRCWKCFDLTGEFADVSFGDAWEMGTGWSRVICRTSQGETILREMAKNGRLTLLPSSAEEVCSANGKIMAYKKKAIAVRQKALRNFPDYQVPMRQPRGMAKIKAQIFLACLRFGNTRMAHTILRITPIRLLEKASVMARKGTLRELFRYGFWGVVTICISFFSYWAFLLVGLDYRVANLLSMLMTKSFAYLSNKFFVFHSKQKTKQALFQEIALFIATRGLSGAFEYVGLILLVDICKIGRLVGKGLMIVLTTIINYVFGKVIVYKDRENLK